MIKHVDYWALEVALGRFSNCTESRLLVMLALASYLTYRSCKCVTFLDKKAKKDCFPNLPPFLPTHDVLPPPLKKKIPNVLLYVHYFLKHSFNFIHKAHNFHLRRVKLIWLLVDTQTTEFTFQVICSNFIFKMFLIKVSRVLLLVSTREQWSESEHDSSNPSTTNQADFLKMCKQRAQKLFSKRKTFKDKFTNR